MAEPKRKEDEGAPTVFRKPGVKNQRTSEPGALRLPHEDLIRREADVLGSLGSAAAREGAAPDRNEAAPAVRAPARTVGKGTARLKSRVPAIVEGAVGSDESPPSCESLPVEFEHYEALWEVLEYSDPKRRTLRVFLNLVATGSNRKCYIKGGQLERWAKMEERQARQTLASLREIGWVKKLREYDGHNRLGPLYEVPRELPKTVAARVEMFKRLQSF